MRIKLFATLRALAGARDVELDFGAEHAPRVCEILDRIVARVPEVEALLFDSVGVLYPHVQLLINGREVRYLPDGLDTRVTAGDTVDLFPAVGGG